MITSSVLSDEDAKEIALRNAKLDPETHMAMIDDFKPNQWVLKAIKEAYLSGRHAERLEHDTPKT